MLFCSLVALFLSSLLINLLLFTVLYFIPFASSAAASRARPFPSLRELPTHNGSPSSRPFQTRANLQFDPPITPYCAPPPPTTLDISPPIRTLRLLFANDNITPYPICPLTNCDPGETSRTRSRASRTSSTAGLQSSTLVSRRTSTVRESRSPRLPCRESCRHNATSLNSP